MHYILVVDDEADACDLAREILEGEGYHVTVAQSAADAHRLLDAQQFSAVLLDHHMPGGNGTVIADRLLKTMSPERIFYITADAAQGRVRSVVPFLQKPYDPRTLLLMLKNALSREPQKDIL